MADPTSMGPGWILETVVSGMQTGVDQVALVVARELGYKTGGWAPKGFRTDTGNDPAFGRRYALKEHPMLGYNPRTFANVRDSDATVLFGVLTSPGCKYTLTCIRQLGKLSVENPTVSELQAFILTNAIKILNVAGNRLRTHPESTARARVVLTAGLLPF